MGFVLTLASCHVIVSSLSELLMTDDFVKNSNSNAVMNCRESSSHMTKAGRGKETKTQSSELLFCTV